MVISSLPTAIVSSPEFDFDAGLLCLDFTNTVPVHPGSGSGDHYDEHAPLESYADLVEWAKQAGQVDEPTAAQLLGNAAAHPAAATIELKRALNLREAIYRLVVAAIEGGNPDPGDLSRFNAALRAARERLTVRWHDGVGFSWAWKDLGSALAAPLAPVLESAAQLFTSPADLARVRRCGGDRCDWLFVDTTKNRSRRWCSMSGCGNRAKAKRHYQRERPRA